MIAEIAAANAAFAIIKSALNNGKQIYDVAESASTYFDNKSTITKKAKQNGNKQELAAFMELQKLKKEEEWLKEYMIYAGDPGLWDAWLQFQSDAKRARERQAAENLKNKRESNALIFLWLKGVGSVLLIVPLVSIMASMWL